MKMIIFSTLRRTYRKDYLKNTEINIDSLNNHYRKDCIDDGDEKSFTIKKDSISKTKG
jgi:hypothetical protein